MIGTVDTRGIGGLAGALLLAAGLAVWAAGAGPWVALIGLILLGFAIWSWWDAQLPPNPPLWLRHAVLAAFAAEAVICGVWTLLCLSTFGADVALRPSFDDPRHLPLIATLAVIASAALARWALDVRADRSMALWGALALGGVAGAAEVVSLGHGMPPAFAGLRLVHLALGLAGLALVRSAGRAALTLGVLAWMGVSGLWSILFLAAWLA